MIKKNDQKGNLTHEGISEIGKIITLKLKTRKKIFLSNKPSRQLPSKLLITEVKT